MLNQLETLTERVGGSNELVDRWLQVRKHLLVAYYNLVGLKPGKESFMRLNEKALDDFCQTWWITSPPVILIFMNALSAKWKGYPTFSRHADLSAAGSQYPADYGVLRLQPRKRHRSR
jgi:hypothetical protein